MQETWNSPLFISSDARLRLKKIVLFCLNIFSKLTNSLDPNEMPHDAAFHLGLHFLQKYPFRDFQYTKG